MNATKWPNTQYSEAEYLCTCTCYTVAVLCQSVVRVAEKNGGYLVNQANQVTTLFTETFGVFALCHIYNAKLVTEQEMHSLVSMYYILHSTLPHLIETYLRCTF